MPIATLPLVLAVVLLELAIGGAFLLWALDRTRQAPGGFLKLVAGVDAIAGILAFLILPALPRTELARQLKLNEAALGSLSLATSVLAVLLIAQLIVTFVPWRTLRAIVGLLSLLVGGAALIAAAVARPAPDETFDLFALMALPLGAVALGGTGAAMLLGHWYLVTPKLSPLPLQRASVIVLGAIALQVGVVAVTLTRVQPSVFFESSLEVALAIRIGVGLLMTFALVAAAWWTARMNTQSSTGLLYVGLGTVLAGEVAARVVYYLTGVAV
jgi:hypothetical protein